jgi:hypothetical protein
VSEVATTTTAAPAREAAAAKRWLVYAALWLVARVAIYFLWPAAYFGGLDSLTGSSMWFCLVMWGRLSGFARGWRAAERERL